MLWERIEKLLEERKMTRYALAKKTHVSYSVIHALGSGKIKKPSFELVCKIADALEVDINELRGAFENGI